LIGGILPKLQNRAANGYRPHYLVQDGLTVLHALNDCMLGALAGRQFTPALGNQSSLGRRKNGHRPRGVAAACSRCRSIQLPAAPMERKSSVERGAEPVSLTSTRNSPRDVGIIRYEVSTISGNMTGMTVKCTDKRGGIKLTLERPPLDVSFITSA
jgi:hypothetical protein